MQRVLKVVDLSRTPANGHPSKFQVLASQERKLALKKKKKKVHMEMQNTSNVHQLLTRFEHSLEIAWTV